MEMFFTHIVVFCLLLGALARIHRWTRTEGVRTQEGGVRKLQTRWSGSNSGRRGVGGGLQAFLGATMSAYSGCCERDGGIRRSKRCSRTELVRVCGDVQLAGWRVSGGRAPSGGERQRSESSEGATELGFPGPTLGQMQSEAARRAGEPSGHGKEAASQGLGGHDLLAQTDARRPAGQVVGDHLHGQPGAVGGEAARGEMVEPHAVLEVSDGVLDLGVAPMVGLQLAVIISFSDMTMVPNLHKIDPNDSRGGAS